MDPAGCGDRGSSRVDDEDDWGCVSDQPIDDATKSEELTCAATNVSDPLLVLPVQQSPAAASEVDEAQLLVKDKVQEELKDSCSTEKTVSHVLSDSLKVNDIFNHFKNSSDHSKVLSAKTDSKDDLKDLVKINEDIILQSLQNRDNYLYEKCYISDELSSSKMIDEQSVEKDESAPADEILHADSLDSSSSTDDTVINFEIETIQVEPATVSLIVDQSNNYSDSEVACSKTDENFSSSNLETLSESINKDDDAQETKDQFKSKKSKESGEIIDDMQNMKWLKLQSSSNMAESNRTYKLQEVVKKQDEEYFQGTRRNTSNKKRNNKKQATASVKGQADNQLVEDPKQKLVEKDEAVGDKEQIPLAGAACVKEQSLVIHDDDLDESWGGIDIHRNLPEELKNSGNGDKPDNGPFDKYGRVGGYTEKHMYMGKGARKREQEMFNSGNQSQNDSGDFEVFLPNSEPSNIKPSHTQAERDFNKNRPIRGRDFDQDSQRNRNQRSKFGRKEEEASRGQQNNQNFSNRGSENQKGQTSVDQNQSRPIGNTGFPNRTSNRIPRQPVRDDFSKNQSVNNDKAQNSQFRDQHSDGFRIHDQRYAAQNSQYRDQHHDGYRTQQDQKNAAQNSQYTNQHDNNSRAQGNRCETSQYQNNAFRQYPDSHNSSQSNSRCQNNANQDLKSQNYSDSNKKPRDDRWNSYIKEKQSNTNQDKDEYLCPEHLKEKMGKNLQEKAAAEKEEYSNDKFEKKNATYKETPKDFQSTADKKVTDHPNEKFHKNQTSIPAMATAVNKEDKPEAGIQNASSEPKPNVVMDFQGNQNVQCALGLESNAAGSVGPQNVSRNLPTSNAATVYDTAAPLQQPAVKNESYSPSISCANSPMAKYGAGSPINVHAQPFKPGGCHLNLTSIQYPDALEIYNLTKVPINYYPMAGGHDISDEQREAIEANLMKRLSKETENVLTARQYLASAEAILFATQAELKYFRACYPRNQTAIDDTPISSFDYQNSSLRNRGETSSPLFDPQHNRNVAPPPGFSSTSTGPNNYPRNNQADNFGRPNYSMTSRSQDYPSEAYILHSETKYSVQPAHPKRGQYRNQ